jgi:hypothetical protein
MADILPPAPIDAPFASYNWTDWYKKVRDAINKSTSVAWSIVTATPTTLAGYGITDAQNISGKDAASGYAGLNAVSRTTKGVDTTDDIITDSTAKGPVMKSPNGHYWRATISNAGVITWTDLGTTKP